MKNDVTVFRIYIRIRRIHMFLGLLDPYPDPLVRGTGPRIRIRTKMSRIPGTDTNIVEIFIWFSRLATSWRIAPLLVQSSATSAGAPATSPRSVRASNSGKPTHSILSWKGYQIWRVRDRLYGRCSAGVAKKYRHLGWPTAPSYMSPNAGGGRELRGLSLWVQLYTGAQINFGDLTPYLAYGVRYSFVSKLMLLMVRNVYLQCLAGWIRHDLLVGSNK